MSAFRPVLVQWLDAVEKDWALLEDSATLPRPVRRQSVGYLVEDGNHVLVLAQTLHEADGGITVAAHLLAIPKGSIVHVQALEPAEVIAACGSP